MNKLLFILLSFILTACGWPEIHENHSLVDVKTIAKKLANKETVQLIDVRTEDEYLHSHIPGARNIWRHDIRDRYNEIEGMRLPKTDLEELMESLGISDKDSIYLYDAIGNVDAARLWWMLKIYGFEKVALIDGGFIQWRLKGFDLNEGEEVYPPSHFVFSGEGHPEWIATKEEVAANKFEQIVDTRSDKEYTGKVIKNGAFRGGHIPGSTQFDYIEMVSGGSFKFQSKERILRLLDGKKIDEDKSIVVYCHSGVRSALALFVFTQIAGLENVSNYNGSWIEWSGDESLPVEKPENAN